MDITEEMQKFYAVGNEELQKDIQEQIEILRKKAYLFNVLNVSEEFDKKIASCFFEQAGIQYLELKQYHDYDIGEVFELRILDEQKKEVSRYDGSNHTVEFEFIENLLGHYYFVLEDNLFNLDIDGKTIILELNQEFKDKLQSICLNDELMTLSNYVKLDKEVPQNTNKNHKKRKI
jgi:hypothetical protein